MKRALIVMFLLAPATAFGDGTAPAKRGPPPNYKCPGAEYRQFDFMVGDWRAGPTGKTVQPARSKWVALGSCAILEHWMPRGGEGGYSMNYFDQSDRAWHQHWVDATGDAVDYVGHKAGKKLEFTADDVSTPQMQKVKLTMTFERLANGSVRQSGAQSTDGGKTFQTAFDFTYVPSKP